MLPTSYIKLSSPIENKSLTPAVTLYDDGRDTPNTGDQTMLAYDKRLIEKASIHADVMVCHTTLGHEVYDASPRVPKLLGITQDEQVASQIRNA